MAASPPQVFKGITPEQYARLTEKAGESGIALSGPSGTASKFGVEVTWNYSQDTRELTLQCLKTPFFVKAAEVDAKIATLVQQSLA
jgi:hypothetical protein